MLKKSLLLVAASAVSVSAFAGGMGQTPVASSHAYAGAQVGYAAHYGFDKIGKENKVASVYSKEQGDFAARVYAGYMFSQNFGAELGAGTFGSQEFALGTNGQSAKGNAYNYKTEAQVAFDASLVGQINMTDSLYAFAKAGMAIVDFNTQAISNADNNPSVNNWEWMPRAELGLGYNVTPNMAVTVSYAHYFNMNASKEVKLHNNAADLHKTFKKFSPQFGVATLGLQYNF